MLYTDTNRLNLCLYQVMYRYNTRQSHVCSARDSNGLILYTKGGHKRVLPSGEEFSARAMDFVYLPYGAEYRSTLLESGTEYYQIDFQCVEDGHYTRIFDMPMVIRHPRSEPYMAKIKEIYDMYVEHRTAYAMFCLGKIAEIAAQMLREETEHAAHPTGMERMMKSVEHIRNHYAENTPREELARYSNTCVSNLEKNFMRCFGVSPIAYRNRLRIEHAKMLLEGGCSIAETAAKVGFSDVYYFSRVFRQYAACTPGKFVRQGREQNGISEIIQK